jgi:phosphate acetyltransferase
MDLISRMKENICGAGIRMVFAEGWDSRMINAATKIQAENLMQPILLGDAAIIESTASGLGLSLEGIEVIDPKTFERFDEMVDTFVEIRKGKATKEDAEKMLLKTNYFGTMLIKMELADGLVGGVIYSTGDTIRPALQIIKTKPGVNKVSSMFYMNKDDKAYIFGDCAVNIAPSAQDLVDIAAGCLISAPKFGIENPKIAFLSFSTKGSAKSPEVDKVAEAAEIFKNTYPEVLSDGEMQFDAAIVPSVGIQKAPNSQVAGEANILVFPSLEAGNIGYKIAQRLGGYDALGPILLGLNSPINDLSRGASAEDIYKVAIITAAQVR